MAIETVVEEVALNLEETAQAVRLLNGRTVSFGFGGLVAGAAAGAYFGYRYGKKKTYAEAMARADEEIEEMRDLWNRKGSSRPIDPEEVVAAVTGRPPAPKPSVEAIIRQRGYRVEEDPDTESSELTMDQSSSLAPGRLLRPPVPMPVDIPTPDPDPLPVWNAALEQARRDINRPYVISRDEWHDNAYPKLQYTYYDDDDVLVDEESNVVQDTEAVVGEFSYRFGYGSGDETVVFVRNDQLQRDFEITRVPEAYEQAVLGLDTNDEG